MVAIGTDRRGRADVEAQIATRLGRARMRADRRLVVEELRFLEAPDCSGDLDDGSGLCRCVGPRMPVALRRLMHGKSRLAPQVEHQVEALAAFPCRIAALEVDCADGGASDHAFAMIAA